MSDKKRPEHPNLSRRRFLAGVTAVGAASLLPGCGGDGGPSVPGAGPSPVAGNLPPPEESGIDHIVQVMMENRSFDHFLGWVPGADGRQAGVRYRNIQGAEVETFRMTSDPAYMWQGCGWADPAHGYDDGRTHMNGGAMDGWLLTDGTASNPADKFPVGYYTGEDLPFYKGVAEHFTVCDRYFHGILASTFPNRIYIHAGAADRLNNTLPYAQAEPSVLPTIWDGLLAKGVSCANYFFDLPTPGLWGDKYASILKPYAQFLADAQAGTLPAVSYIDPFFGASVGESPAGVSRDDHPQADVRDGQALLDQIYQALSADPERWARTLMIVTYDEWGGFYDHVVPPYAPISAEEAAVGNDGRLGFRVPCVLLGGRVRKAHVSSLQFDPSSVINLIAWRHGVPGVGARAATSLNMALALDFDNPARTDAPSFGVSQGPFGGPCTQAIPLPLGTTGAAAKSQQRHQSEWDALADMCRRYRLI